MKLLHIIAKNFKILFRSKTSALMLLVGPLFIILLVGLAFNSQSTVQLTVGVATQDTQYTPLAEQFITTLGTKFQVVRTSSADDCVQQIKQGTAHACIVFPKDFEVSDNHTNEMVFYVDQTRSNLVYEIQNALSSRAELQASQLSTGLTNSLLDVISDAKKTNDDVLVRLLKVKTSLDSMDADLTTIKSRLDGINLDAGNISVDDAQARLATLNVDISTWALDGSNYLDEAKVFIQKALVNGASENESAPFSVFTFETKTTDFNRTNTNDYNATFNDAASVNAALASASRNIDDLKNKIQYAQDAKGDISARVASLKKSLADTQSDIAAAKQSLETLRTKINGLTVTNAQNIVTPFTTKVEPVVSRGTNLSYFFPYLVVLIVMFISILLSSTMVVMEKNSKAYFRNFATPTRDLSMIIATFITNFLVVVLEVAVILAMAYYFMTTSVFTNFSLVLALLCLSICLFTLIGMALGYLLKTQEGSMLASIAVGSVFLLLSNLIIPLESMAALMQKVAPFNPYVVASEALRKLILFKLTWLDLSSQFVYLFIVSAVIFALMVTTQQLAKIRYFTKMPHVKEKGKESAKDIPSFKLANNVLITSLEDLARELETMEDDVFNAHVSRRHNDFYTWIKDGVEDKELAEKIKNKTEKSDLRKTLLKELEH